MRAAYRLPRLSADSDGDLKAAPGRFVRRWGIDPSTLPSSSSAPKDIIPLLTAIWTEAVYFVSKAQLESASKKTPWHPAGTKTFPNSKAPVSLFERVVTTDQLARVCEEHKLSNLAERDFYPETWTLRRSIHEDAAMTGTADWREWVRHFKDNHAESEKAFTATILNTRLMKKWNCKDIKIQIGGRFWVNWTMKWEESVHKLPFPLKNRVFPVLQITAMTEDKREFFVVQIAVKDEDATPRNAGAILGVYTSVERLYRTADGVEWIMGTVSDARGFLPRWVQKKAVPDQIAKDVDMFLAWIASERKKHLGSEEDTPSPAPGSRSASVLSRITSGPRSRNASIASRIASQSGSRSGSVSVNATRNASAAPRNPSESGSRVSSTLSANEGPRSPAIKPSAV